MAQQTRERDLGVSRADTQRIARRLGLEGHRPAMVAAGVLVVGLCALGVILAGGLPSSGFELTRSEQVQIQETADEAAASETPEAEGLDATADERPREIVVHVDGAVKAPGVCRLVGDDLRVVDAVNSAGGLSEDAETGSINLAATLEDGSKVYVPHKGEAYPEPSGTLTRESDGTVISPQGDGKINVNTATAAELQTLPGIGEAMAAAIIEERTTGGPFSSVDDLQRVSGIGEKRLAKIRDDVCV